MGIYHDDEEDLRAELATVKAERDEALAAVGRMDAALREAVGALPKYECAAGYKCDLCAFANADRAAARKLAGLGE